MPIAEPVFWICLFLVAYTYLLYPALLFFLSAFIQAWRDWQYLVSRRERRRRAPAAEELPAVSLISPAYNEQAGLRGKIKNLRQLDYPAEKIQVIFVSDGSTDETNDILRAAAGPGIETIFLPRRGGKSNALNQGVASVRHDILVFSDAETLFAPDALRQLVRHFSDRTVGVVCGALQFVGSPESQQTEGVYWRYESMLRLMEARLGATLTASGAIYAIRRTCYPALAPDVMIEDFVIPMNARKLGYRVLYDPEALATDFAAPTVSGEFTRRVRVAVGSFHALRHLSWTLVDPVTACAFFSHKVLRWILPFLLIGLLTSSGALWAYESFRAVFLAQILFYLWGALGFLLRHRTRRVRYALIAYYLVAIHMAFLVGFVRCVTGRHNGVWHKTS
ncbi:MAG: glycosyltransferase family 2 protein [Candidatus Rokubacteria bacterium]|nr:glycosyltransferase family 2 protein [Candidatus Rokubacteria bacterium]